MSRRESQPGNGSEVPTYLGRALIGLASMLFLGVGLGMGVQKGVSFLWTAALLAALLLVMVLLARWQAHPLSQPLSQLLGGTRPRALEDLPRAWSALERENLDLRERAALEDKLLPGIMARLEEGVLLFGVDGRLEQFNPAAQRHLGLGAPLAKGMPVDEVFRDPESPASVQRAFQGVGGEWRLARAGRALRVRAIPFAPTGSVSGVLLTLDDITSQEALETTRQTFISNVSHELKTPVTAIRIAAENLQEEVLPPSAQESAQSILRSVDRLALMLGDLSELSRIESGALHLEPQDLDLETFVGTLVRDLREQHAGTGVTLEKILVAPTGTRILADPLRLHQIIENLVSNAMKFSAPGSKVELSVEVTGHAQSWQVRDQGPGIEPADQGHIFERFYRAQGAKGKPGTGLGLAIVKHLCRLMGGEVLVESRPGEGATFRVMLPHQDPLEPPSR